MTADMHSSITQNAYHAKLGKSCYRSGPDNGVLQHNAVVDVADVLGWLDGLGTLHTEQVQDPYCQFCEFAVLDELAEMCQS